MLSLVRSSLRRRRHPSSTLHRSFVRHLSSIVDITPGTLMSKLMVPSDSNPSILCIYAPSVPSSLSTLDLFENHLSSSSFSGVAGKMNADQHPAILQSLKLSGVPAIITLYERKLLFQPILGQINGEMMDKIIHDIEKVVKDIGNAKDVASDAEKQMEIAEQSLADGNITGAMEIYSAISNQPIPKRESSNDKMPPSTAEITRVTALSGMARCAIADGQNDIAQNIISSLQSEFGDINGLGNHPQVLKAIAECDLSSSVVSGDMDQLLSAVDNDPNDFDARYQLSQLLLTQQKYDEATKHLFKILKKDKYWNDEAAKDLVLRIIDSKGGSSSPEGKRLRRRFESIWFS